MNAHYSNTVISDHTKAAVAESLATVMAHLASLPITVPVGSVEVLEPLNDNPVPASPIDRTGAVDLVPEAVVPAIPRLDIDAAALSKALTIACRVVEKRNSIPILSNVLLEAVADGLLVTATNLDQRIQITVPAVYDPAFKMTLPAHALRDILKSAGPNRVTLEKHAKVCVINRVVNKVDTEVRQEDVHAVLVFSTGAKCTIQALPDCDFPKEFANFKPTHRLPVLASKWHELTKRVSFAISTEETRYYLNGVFFHVATDCGAKYLRMVATDGHRLSMTDTGLEFPEGMPGVIIPRQTLDVLAQILPGKPTKAKRKGDAAADAVTIDLSSTVIRFTCGNVVMTSKLIDGTFPDYQRVIPSCPDKKMTADAASIADLVYRVSNMQSERGRAVKFMIADGKLVATVTDPDKGTFTDSIPVFYESEPLEIGFNSGYLRDILATVAGDVSFLLSDPGSPTRIHPASNPERTMVLMPMRV